MLLRLRIAILVFSAIIFLLMGFSGVLWIKQQRFNEYVDRQFLVDIESYWEQVKAHHFNLLQADAAQILAMPQLKNTIQSGESFYTLNAPLLGLNPQKHGGFYNPKIGFVHIDGNYDTDRDILAHGLYRKIIQSPQPLKGIDLLDLNKVVFWYAQRLPQLSHTSSPTALVLGSDIKLSLNGLQRALGGEIFILNLHRHLIVGTNNNLWQQLKFSPFLREKNVFRLTQLGKNYIVGVIPLKSEDRHTVAALLVMRDLTQRTQHEFIFNLTWISLGILCIGLLAVSIFFYIRNALYPVEKAVAILAKLSKGDYSDLPDLIEGKRPDEAGKIMNAVSVLRDEMINLDRLREEKIRQRRRQETLIRDKLFSLAQSLDEAHRIEIIEELDRVFIKTQTRSDSENNELAILAAILGRMSNLIQSQQQKLLALLAELNKTIEVKAQFARLQQELDIARKIQLSILPHNVCLPDLVTIQAVMMPAKEIGGDFYDYFMLDENNLAIVVADVSGKGVPAAFFMAISRTLLKASALILNAPAACINRLNQFLCQENEQMMFVTAFYGVLNLKTSEFTYVNAGHNPPLKLDNEYKATFLPYAKNVPLAVAENFSYQEERFTLNPGESILLYTDGVTEAMNNQGDLFGAQRLQYTLEKAANIDTNNVTQYITDSLSKHSEQTPQADDITCLFIQFIDKKGQ